jgi:hypothetical protein
MKKIILSVVLIIVSLVSMAHIPTQECSATGWFTYLWSDLGHATAVEITWGQGRHTKGYDTTITNLNLKPITTFQAPVGQDVTFTFNDGYETDFVVKASNCGDLPVLLSTFNTSVESPGVYNVSWTTTMESNNSYFTIQASNDGGAWKTVAIVKSFYADGNGSTPHNYSVVVDADSNNIVQAGLGTKILLFYTIGFVFFMIVGKLRIKRWFTILIALAFISATTSCSKTNEFNSQNKTYKYFRIVQTDKDGTSVNSPVMVVNN